MDLGTKFHFGYLVFCTNFFLPICCPNAVSMLIISEIIYSVLECNGKVVEDPDIFEPCTIYDHTPGRGWDI